MLLLMALHMYVTLLNQFQPIELSRENQISVNPDFPMNDLLSRLATNPMQFRDMTNFTVEEFMDLQARVIPVIEGNARSTGVRHIVSGRPSKLTPQQRLLNFLLYMKHDNIIYMDSMLWNWSRSAIYDDAIFVASCVNAALRDEIRWPSATERTALAQHIPQLSSYIGFVDGSLVRICRPYENEHHSKWFQGRKKCIA